MKTDTKTGLVLLMVITAILLVIVTIQAHEIRQLKRGLDNRSNAGKLVSQYER
jgi:predicted Holliday junction resolvase-like endonuclease